MKRLLSSFAVFVICLMASGQEQESFNYQTVIHNPAGDLLASKTIGVRISILKGNAYDSVVYSEKHSVKSDQHGLISLSVGNGMEKTGNFILIDWSDDKYFLKVEADIDGGINYKDIATTQILNVPYALPLTGSKKTPQLVKEDKLFLSRKYVGRFLDYRQTGPVTYNGPNIIWIKTSMDAAFGKISAYGKKCDFSVGDNLYVKRTYYSPGGVSGYWVYQIENDKSVYYRVTDYQHDRKIPVANWFR